MPKAIITLDDQDGQISMSLFLEGGFNKDSHAHQHAGLVLKYLDSIAGMKTKEAVQWVDGAFMPGAEKLGRPGVYGHMGEPQKIAQADVDALAERTQIEHFHEQEGLQLDGPDGLRLVKG